MTPSMGHRVSLLASLMFAVLALSASASASAAAAAAAASVPVTEYPVPTDTPSGFVGMTKGPNGIWFTANATNEIVHFYEPALSDTMFNVPSPAMDGASMAVYRIPTPASGPDGITTGPDGNLWFTEHDANKIGRLTPTGTFTEFSIPTANSGPTAITSGPDGNLWFTETNANKIGRITPSGSITEFSDPDANSGLAGITAGSDGNLYFTESDLSRIGSVSTAGVFHQYQISESGDEPANITLGPNGNVWFTEPAANMVGTLISGSITNYTVPTANSDPTGITSGSDGNLWVTEGAAGKVAKLTTSGSFSDEYTVPTPNSALGQIVQAADGANWFLVGSAGQLDRVATSGSILSVADLTQVGGPPGAITRAADGSIWFTEQAGEVGTTTNGTQITDYSGLSGNELLHPYGITADPDGDLWVTDTNAANPMLAPNSVEELSFDGNDFDFNIGGDPQGVALDGRGNLWYALSSDSVIGEIQQAETPEPSPRGFPTMTSASGPEGIALGPDGNMWFTEATVGKIGTITPDGVVSEYPLPPASDPQSIVAGPDGNLWFTEEGTDQIGRITTAGAISQFPIPTANSRPTGIAVGPDGALWFTEQAGDQIGRITTAGVVTEYPVPTAAAGPTAITAGVDDALWFTESIGQLGELQLSAPTITSPATATFVPGEHGTFTVTTTGFTAPAISDGSAHLPSGISFKDDANGTATLSGTTTRQFIGLHQLTLSAANGIAPTGTQTLTLDVLGAPHVLAGPKVNGKLLRGETVTCSPGRWTNSPTFSYQWYRWNTPLPGATKSRYTIRRLDQGSRLSCQVTATNPGGTSHASSPARHIVVPFRKGCPQATGVLAGTTLGLVHLGLTPAAVRHVYRFSSRQAGPGEDSFCFSPAGTRVGYASSALAAKLGLGHKLIGRVIWTTSGNPRYVIAGVRVGATSAAVKKGLRHGSLHDGQWYLVAGRSATEVVQIRAGIAIQVGIAVRAASRNPSAERALVAALG
jgi:streptogramin lyase